MTSELTQNVVNQIQQQQQQQQPYKNQPIDIEKLSEFHRTVTDWITDINMDFKNGYLKSPQTSPCGERLKDLITYMATKSPELATIRVQKRQANTSCWQKVRRTLYFILETFIPSIIALITMYTIYTLLTYNYIANTETPQHKYTPIYNTDAELHLRSYQYIVDTYNILPSLNHITGTVGSLLGAVIGATGVFGMNLVDSATGITYIINKIQSMCIAAVIAYTVFRITHPITYIVAEARKTTDKHEIMLLLQSEFEEEYIKVISQSLYSLFVVNVLDTLEQLLFMSSKSTMNQNQSYIMLLSDTYCDDISLLYYTIMTQHEKTIRIMDPMDVLRVSQPTPQFIALMLRLIRESNEELSYQYMMLNQSMLEAPREMYSGLTTPVHTAAQSLKTISALIPQVYITRNMLI